MLRLSRPLGRLLAALLILLPIATPAEEKAATIRPALWKVADEDTTIYLFGTVHVLPDGVAWFDGKVAEAFNHSQELVTEIAETDAKANQGNMLARAVLTNGQTLRAMMSDDERARYEAALAQLGMPAQSFDGYEPWLAAMVLSLAPLAKSGFAASNGVDQALGVRAKARTLAHRGLETYEYQIGLFDSLPLDTQKVYLAQVVSELPTIKEDVGRMVEAWKQGDAEELARLMNAEEDFPGMYETLLLNRNRNWASWIRQRMTQPGTVFLAVGAGHLAGAGSLQEQLKLQGIASERVQ